MDTDCECGSIVFYKLSDTCGIGNNLVVVKDVAALQEVVHIGLLLNRKESEYVARRPHGHFDVANRFDSASNV